jgi:hypothetical protein
MKCNDLSDEELLALEPHIDQILEDYREETYLFVTDMIESLPRYMEKRCACGTVTKVSSLVIDFTCPSCGKKSKLWGWGSIGTDLRDVILAALSWEEKDTKQGFLRKVKTLVATLVK